MIEKVWATRNQVMYIVKLLLFFFWTTSGVTSLKEVQLIVPNAVQLGDTVLLGCKWTLDSNETLYSVKWYRGRQEFFRYIPKELPHTRVFPQQGITVDISKSGPQQVVLRRASRALAGRYRCEVSADAPSFHTEVRSSYIHVVELPESAPTIRSEKGWYASGDSLRAKCFSPPADPPANLTWLLNGRSIQGQPVIQQRILPSPAVSIDHPFMHTTTTLSPQDEINQIIFSPWKALGPFVDNVPEDTLANQDSVILPTTGTRKKDRDKDKVIDELDVDVTESTIAPTPEVSRRVSSVSQLSFMVRPDSFERGRLTLTCVSSVHQVYSAKAELVIEEEKPQIASVLGTRDASSEPVRASMAFVLGVTALCSLRHIIMSLQR